MARHFEMFCFYDTHRNIARFRWQSLRLAANKKSKSIKKIILAIFALKFCRLMVFLFKNSIKSVYQKRVSWVYLAVVCVGFVSSFELLYRQKCRICMCWCGAWVCACRSSDGVACKAKRLFVVCACICVWPACKCVVTQQHSLIGPHVVVGKKDAEPMEHRENVCAYILFFFVVVVFLSSFELPIFGFSSRTKIHFQIGMACCNLQLVNWQEKKSMIFQWKVHAMLLFWFAISQPILHNGKTNHVSPSHYNLLIIAAYIYSLFIYSTIASKSRFQTNWP